MPEALTVAMTWSMASFVVVVISLGGIYRQLRAQGSANAIQRIESLQGQFASDKMTYTRLALALNLKYEPLSARTFELARPILDFISNLGGLHEAGYISLQEVDDTWGSSIHIWTALLTSVVERQRVIDSSPDAYDAQGLITKLHELETKQGRRHLNLDKAAQAEYLELIIERNRVRLELDREWKSGVIPTAPRTAEARASAAQAQAGSRTPRCHRVGPQRVTNEWTHEVARYHAEPSTWPSASDRGGSGGCYDFLP